MPLHHSNSWKPREEKEYNFHNDESLRDRTPATPAWNSNISGDVWAIAKGIVQYAKHGFGQAAKETVSTLDINDPLSRAITKKMVSNLWGSMLHPPLSFRGHEFQYRAADGSNNNQMYPFLGQAGRPYAKSVQSNSAKHGARPDPGDLFDLLLARTDDGHESETGISSMLLYQASIVIHDIFRSNDLDKNISDTSSYLDLSPLYGKDEAAQEQVRLFKDGLLKPDTFAEHRLLNQPPAVSIFLIMYNRFHNYAAEKLLKINENSKFSLPPTYDVMSDEEKSKAKAKQDEDLFQTARLITCGLYAQIAIHDYLRCLMMIHERDTAWTLDPRTSFPNGDDKHGLSRGEGNMVSVEFNLLYRFHSPISKRDAEWSKALFELWLQRDVDDNATPEQIIRGEKLTSAMLEAGDIPVPLMERKIVGENQDASARMAANKAAPYFPLGFDRVGGDFSDMKNHPERQFVFRRDENGKFDDEQLMAELVRAIEDPICSWGARGIPKIFKSIEMLGILQSRKWEVATLNEFREFFGMSRHERFEDINSDPKIQQALRDLYDDPDMVEFYPGYVVEGNGRNCDPTESCPGDEATALWRGVFSDAVTLVRSDRFYTIDWNVDSITAWGMKEVTSDPEINKGSMLYKLYQRAFPGFFTYNALHLWEPYYTPAKNLVLAQKQGHIDDLNLDGLEYQYEGDGELWQPLVMDRSPEGNVVTNFHKMATKQTRRDPSRIWRVRRVLRQIEKTPWRGNERAVKVTSKIHVERDYTAIRERILSGSEAFKWSPRDIDNDNDIPAGPLRRIYTNTFRGLADSVKIVSSHLTGRRHEQKIVRKYFDCLAEEIRLREQRNFQRHNAEEVFQLDMVRDFAIPIITRFAADLLGFWESVKTPDYIHREYDENEIYHHIENCQNYSSWNTDETQVMRRRLAFRSSIELLKGLAERGVNRSAAGPLGLANMTRSYGYKGDDEPIQELRKLAVGAIQHLLRAGHPREEVAAIMLAFVLETANKAVIKFTETLAYFIHPHNDEGFDDSTLCSEERGKLWANIQRFACIKGEEESLAAAEEIDKYVLEAQRLSLTMKLAFRWTGPGNFYTREVINADGWTSPGPLDQFSFNNMDANQAASASSPTSPTKKEVEVIIKPGEQILVDIHHAGQDATAFPGPHEFRIDRDVSAVYAIYGTTTSTHSDDASPTSPSSAKQMLTLAALTGMLKHAAQLKELRPAHGKSGRLKRIVDTDPATGLRQVCYMNAQWNALTHFPATWNLRYNGKGRGIWTGQYTGRDMAAVSATNGVFERKRSVSNWGTSTPSETPTMLEARHMDEIRALADDEEAWRQAQAEKRRDEEGSETGSEQSSAMRPTLEWTTERGQRKGKALVEVSERNAELWSS